MVGPGPQVRRDREPGGLGGPGRAGGGGGEAGRAGGRGGEEGDGLPDLRGDRLTAVVRQLRTGGFSPDFHLIHA